MKLIEQRIVDAILAGQLDLLRFEAGVRAQVLGLLEKLRKELRATLAQEDLTKLNKQRTAVLLKQTDTVIEQYYTQMQGALDTALTGAAQASAQQSVKALSLLAINMEIALPTKTYLEKLASNVLIFGAPSRDWWEKQGADAAFRFSNSVRQGLLRNETNEQIVRRVVGDKMTDSSGNIWNAARANIRALVHSSVQAVSAEARRETYRKNSDVVKGIEQHSTFDSHTTDVCIAYNGQQWDIDALEPMPGSSLPYNGGVPRHWNCRSAELPVLRSFRELGLDMDQPDVGTRASSEGQIKADTTFEQWLSRRTEAQQDEQLGKGRAQLWRDGKITLEQLLSLDGNPLTLAQLEKKYG